MSDLDRAMRVDPTNPATWVLFAPINDTVASDCLVLAREVRSWGIPTMVDGRPNRLKKKIQWAVEMRCFFVVIVGPDDLSQGVVQVKDLDDNVQEAVPSFSIGHWLAERLLGPEELRAESHRRVLAADDTDRREAARIRAKCDAELAPLEARLNETTAAARALLAGKT